jgi:Leucine-rich repeat (LRR) protein
MEISINDKGLKGVFDIVQYCKDININIEKVTKLDCENNKLTELKDLDKLVKLELLCCDNNKLTELKGLDKLINLKWLHCDNNKLTELDLSKLVNLKELYCYNNDLVELDLSKLFNLRWINGKEYRKPKPDRIAMIIDKIEKMEKDIAEMKEIIGR